MSVGPLSAQSIMNFADLNLYTSDIYSILFTCILKNIASRKGAEARYGRQDDR